jgi:hypothetical protein
MAEEMILSSFVQSTEATKAIFNGKVKQQCEAEKRCDLTG